MTRVPAQLDVVAGRGMTEPVAGYVDATAYRVRADLHRPGLEKIRAEALRR